ncbi:TPA: hypothetical protein ACS3GE_001222 [Legionella pneumophila]|uniref:hypothetical protein n=1 Tax=Legionella pneumophila TaxID=446 RepID=UPI0001E3C3EC|nr:hypothetical protein [Legionella pneumophila]HAT9827386.1 hypothetical protein [Legionella pneumophila subsp. pneumophila]MCO1452408.1 hypothetical protein [Legionella pneumophila]MDI0458441.1 hypothetical protein [Legionella pneumophila]MDI0461046.1 hypothetical protein [Legionella pneumophila]MDI2024582.1 hypothetical protein [Legionella pneumophila]
MKLYKINLAITIIILLLNLNTAHSEGSTIEKDAEVFKKLMLAKSLECRFPMGVLVSWKEDAFNIQKDQMGDAIHFDNIDIDAKNHARMIGNLGATDVYAFASPGGLTFIEKTKFGYLNITTIFPEELGNTKINGKPEDNDFLFQDAYMAVTSRNYYDFIFKTGPSQYYGYCRILE